MGIDGAGGREEGGVGGWGRGEEGEEGVWPTVPTSIRATALPSRQTDGEPTVRAYLEGHGAACVCARVCARAHVCVCACASVSLPKGGQSPRQTLTFLQPGRPHK